MILCAMAIHNCDVFFSSSKISISLLMFEDLEKDSIQNHSTCCFSSETLLKDRLHRRFLSRQLDAIFVAAKLHQLFETPTTNHTENRIWFTCAILELQLKHDKIASSCCGKNRLCKWAFSDQFCPQHYVTR